MKMKANVHVMELTVRVEIFLANLLAQLADLKLGATIIIMTETMSKENETNLMKVLWSAGKDWVTAPSSSSAVSLIQASCRIRWLHPSSGRPFLRLSFSSF